MVFNTENTSKTHHFLLVLDLFCALEEQTCQKGPLYGQIQTLKNKWKFTDFFQKNNRSICEPITTDMVLYRVYPNDKDES